MKTHDRHFFDRVIVFNRMFSNLCRYHKLREINVEQTGTAINTQWPVATDKVSEMATETQNEQQNLQLNNLLKKSFGAWTCNHSMIPHFVASAKMNAAANAMTATQQTKSIIGIAVFLVFQYTLKAETAIRMHQELIVNFGQRVTFVNVFGPFENPVDGYAAIRKMPSGPAV